MIHTVFIIIAILYSFKVQSILLIILSLIFLGIFIFSIKKFKTLKNTLDIAIAGTKKSYLLVFIFVLLGALLLTYFL